MDEDVTIRAITIGASVLIAIATISAVLTYYNSAKEMVRRIGSGTDIAGLYEQGIEETLLKGTITGTEVKNLLNYFNGRDDVSIMVKNILIAANDDGQNTEEKNASSYADYRDDYDEIIKFILPNSTYTLSHSMSGGILEIKISGS